MENTFQPAEIIEADMTQIELELSLACGEFDFISPLTDEVISDNAYIGRLYAACKLRIVQLGLEMSTSIGLHLWPPPW